MPKFYLEKVCYELPILDSYNVYFSKQLFLIKIGKCDCLPMKMQSGRFGLCKELVSVMNACCRCVENKSEDNLVLLMPQCRALLREFHKDYPMHLFSVQKNTFWKYKKGVSQYTATAESFNIQIAWRGTDRNNLEELREEFLNKHEQEFVDQGKYMDISEMNQWWDRLIPSMRDNCTDLNTGKQFRVCTNMTMAGFWYNKEMFQELGLEVATTWDQFVANLEAIKAAYPDVDPWFIFGEAWHLGHLIEFLPHGYIKAKYGAIGAKQAFLSNDAETLKSICPFCWHKKKRIYFTSPDWTWRELCGRNGELIICEHCKIQYGFDCDEMN